MYLTTLVTEVISNVEFIQRNLTIGNNKMFDDPATIENSLNTVWAWLHNRDYVHDIDRRIAKEVLPLYFELTQPEERDEHLNEVYAKYFTGKPARSCVAVKALPKGVLCEVEVIAVK